MIWPRTAIFKLDNCAGYSDKYECKHNIHSIAFTHKLRWDDNSPRPVRNQAQDRRLEAFFEARGETPPTSNVRAVPETFLTEINN
ncbi:unnamed protein product, partial [Brenthis ino]